MTALEANVGSQGCVESSFSAVRALAGHASQGLARRGVLAGAGLWPAGDSAPIEV